MKAKDLRNSILQMAVQGKLVPQDPSDEPASVLLERIRAERAKLIKEKKIKAPKGGESVIYRASDGSHYEKRGKGEPVCIDDEIPFDIPESWEWARLESISSKITDGEHKTPHRIDTYDGFYLLSARNIREGFIALDDVDYVDEEEYLRISKRCNPQRGDVLISCSGSIGRVAVVNDGNKYVMVRSAAMVSPIEVEPRYIEAALQSPLLQTQMTIASKQTAQANLFQGAITQLLMPMPPLAEQLRIVHRFDCLQPYLSHYETLESQRERFDAELPNRLRKSILQLAVQGKLVKQDSSDESASVLLERIRDERAKLIKQEKLKAPKGGESVIYRASDGGYYEKRGKGEPVRIDDEIPFEIPESWAWARVKDFGFFSSGKTPSKHDQSLYGGNNLWVTSKDMKCFKIAHTGITLSDKGAAGLNTYPVGTMLFVVRSGILKRFLPIAILDKPATINQDIKALMLYLPTIALGLAYFIKAFEPYILEELTKSVTTVDSLRFDEFQDLLIPVPPEAEWNRIVAQLDIALGDVITNQ